MRIYARSTYSYVMAVLARVKNLIVCRKHMFTHINIAIKKHIHIYIHTHMHTDTHTHTDRHTHTHIHTQRHTHTHTETHTQTHTPPPPCLPQPHSSTLRYTLTGFQTPLTTFPGLPDQGRGKNIQPVPKALSTAEVSSPTNGTGTLHSVLTLLKGSRREADEGKSVVSALELSD